MVLFMLAEVPCWCEARARCCHAGPVSLPHHVRAERAVCGIRPPCAICAVLGTSNFVPRLSSLCVQECVRQKAEADMLNK